MTAQLPRPFAPFVLFALLAVTGCGKSGPVLAPVSGTVTFDGKPLAEGTLYFKTIETGALESMTIKDGKFEGRAEVGERRVEVNAYQTKALKDDLMKGEIKINLVAEQYNFDSKLKATVTASGPNEFRFDVKSK